MLFLLCADVNQLTGKLEHSSESEILLFYIGLLYMFLLYDSTVCLLILFVLQIFISRGLNKKYASVLAPGQHEGLG